MNRDRIVSLRLTAAERDRLSALADVYGTDQSTVIRDLISKAPLYLVRWNTLEPARAPLSGDLSALLRRRIEERTDG